MEHRISLSPDLGRYFPSVFEPEYNGGCLIYEAKG